MGINFGLRIDETADLTMSQIEALLIGLNKLNEKKDEVTDGKLPFVKYGKIKRKD